MTYRNSSFPDMLVFRLPLSNSGSLFFFLIQCSNTKEPISGIQMVIRMESTSRRFCQKSTLRIPNGRDLEEKQEGF